MDRGEGSSPLVVVGAQLVVVVLIVRPRCLSSSFSNVVRRNDALLVVGGVRRLRAVIAVSIECGGGGVIVCVSCRSWVAGVGAPHPVGFPGLWAVVLWSFEGLPFVAGGDALSWW